MRKIILYPALILLFAANLACSTLAEPIKPPPPEPEVKAKVINNLDGLGEEVIDELGVEDSLPPSHLMKDVAGKISPDDRKYLDEKCSRCHDLDRILWTHRAPRSVWEKVLDEPQHREMELDWAEKERIYKIFQPRQ